jgi:MFS family permease
LATTILASSLAFVDGSVVNVGLPAIGRSLSADAAALQWVINAFLLPLSALLLLGGGEEKGRAVGLWAATGAIMGAIGPVLGGWLIDLGSWRAIFLINLPLAAVLIAGILLFALASIECAAAPSLNLLLAGRSIQGVVAAMLMPNSLAVLGSTFSAAGDRFGRRRMGSLIVGLGFLLALGFDGKSSYWTSMFPTILVIALGLSGAVAPPTTAVLSSVDARHTAAASGFNSARQQEPRHHPRRPAADDAARNLARVVGHCSDLSSESPVSWGRTLDAMMERSIGGLGRSSETSAVL